MTHRSGPDPEFVSEWVARWAHLVERGPVLDVASGGGRHARFFAARGLEVVAVDRAPAPVPGARVVAADLEDGSPWPFGAVRFAAIVVTNYLHRPLLPRLAESLDSQGILIYETFMAGNERFGKPSSPAFLLAPGELLAAFAGLSVVAFEQGEVARPRAAVLQRLCARAGPIDGVRIGDQNSKSTP